MKFSIITPEHQINNVFINELYDSIKQQSYSNWEWILYLNGECKPKNIPDNIKKDNRVKIYEGESHPNIGYLKNKAFCLGDGDILVEVDHDDILAPNCLEELNIAFQDESIGFVYSNDLLYDLREKKLPFSSYYGWTYTLEKFRDEEYYKMDSFPITSHSLSRIWYAPDHVRAWRKTTYHSLGGHNKELSVCDDYELIIRSYLNTKVKFVPKALYYYRYLEDSSNTSLQKMTEIQTEMMCIFHKYGYELAEREAELKNLTKIDISQKYGRRKDYVSFPDDIDITNGIPLPDDSVFIVNAIDILQKFADPTFAMSEIYRVLCDGGWAFIQVPSTDGRGAFQDPSHKSYWNQNTFWYYTNKHKAQFINNTKIRFQNFRLDTILQEDNIAITNAWLCAIKSDTKRPHPIDI